MRTRAPGALIIFALLAMLALLAAIGFGLRFRRYGRDLDSWFALSLTLVLFADLHYVLSPTSASYVLQGDFLRLLAYAVLLFGVWRAIGHAEFGRAVAEERWPRGAGDPRRSRPVPVRPVDACEHARARCGARRVAAPPQAGGYGSTARGARGARPLVRQRHRAVRRGASPLCVDFLAADGVLEVELDIDPAVRLAPDEQIEIFRIVQEGLANARRHAGARSAWVSIEHRGVALWPSVTTGSASRRT